MRINIKKITSILLTLYLLMPGFTISSFFLFDDSSVSIISAQSTSDNRFELSAKTSVGQITLKSNQKDFKADEDIKFSVDKGYSGGLSTISQFGVNLIESGLDIIGRDSSHEIKVEMKNPENTVVGTTEFDYKSSPTNLTLDNSDPIPGKYTLTVTDVNSGKNISQDFTWGVLAINTNKSVYTPGETAKLAIAVLDDRGEMVCDASLKLSISAPGFSKELTSQNGEIKVNTDICKSKNYTLTPDYETQFDIKGSGSYQMVLTAETKNGTHTITDGFEVKEMYDFDIERTAPTRLYPRNDYPVVIKIKPKNDFKGVIEDTTPEGFMVYYLTSQSLQDKFSITADVEKGLVKTLPGSHNNERKTLRWEVDWKKDEEYFLAYYFKPSQKSPDFFLLGPLILTNQNAESVYNESRSWQLANDVSGDIILLWDTANGSVPGGWTCISCSGGQDFYGVMPRGAASYGGSTAGADTHNTHTLTFSSATNGAAGTGTGLAGSIFSASTHTHTWTGPTEGNGSVLPPFKNLNLIYANNPSTLPSNIIGFFNTTSLPSGWSNYTALNGNYLRGYSDNATGGSDTHSHSVSVTSGSSSNTVSDEGNGRSGANAHTHTLSGNTGTATNAPPYVNVYFAYNSSGGSVSIPDGLFAFFNATPPTNWSSVSGSSPYQNNFLKGATSSLEATGGSSADHNHTATITSGTGGTQPQAAASGSSNATAGVGHTHDVTYTVGNAASLPLYRDVIIGRYTAPGDTFSGYVYTDDTEGTPLTSASVCVAINASHNVADCDASDGTGNFSITTVSDTSANDKLTFFIDGGTNFGNTVTIGTGNNISTMKVYQNHVMVRYETGSSITIANMSSYDNDQNATDILFNATDSTTDTLTVEDGYELYIPSTYTFAPGGNLDSGAGVGVDDIKIVGTYTAASSETILVSGSWACSGTYTTSTSTVTMDAASTTETINSSCAFNNLVLNDGGGSATFQLSASTDVNGNLTITGGNLNANGQNLYIGSTFTNNDTFTSNSNLTTMDGTSGSIAGSSNTSFYNLTIDPTSAGTVTLSASDPTVTNTLNVATGDIFSLSSGRTLTHSGTTLTLDGTISGLGTYIYTGSGNLPTGGTLSTPVRFDATNSDKTITNRTYSGNVELYSNSASSTRNFTLGTAGSQTVTFSGNLTLNAANTQNITLTGVTYNPNVSISGNLTGTAGGSTENISTGTSPWAISGNIDLTNINTFTASNTIQMTGNGKTVTSNGKTFNSFQITGGGNVSNIDALDIDGNFSVTNGTFSMASGAINMYVAGNFSLSSGTTFNGNTTGGKLIFNGATTFTDSRSPIADVGDVQIGNSPGTTNLASDFSANSLTVVAGDVFNTCNYDLDIGNTGITLNTGAPGGILDASETGTTVTCSGTEGDGVTTINDANKFVMNSGASFVYSDSGIIFDDSDGTNAITSNGNSFYDITIDDSNNDASLIMQITDALVVKNNLTITDGQLDANSGGPYQINVGGSWDNDSVFLARGGTVIFDGTSGTKTIDADGTGTDAFYTLTFNDGGGSATYQLTTIMDVDYNLTITGGTFDLNDQSITVGNNWTNNDIFDSGLGTVTMDAADAGNTLNGTMTTPSSFYNLVFNDGGSTGAWTFGANAATVTHDFTITGGAVTAPSSTLTIAEDFTNGDSFSDNTGTVAFNTAATSILSYSAATTFNNLSVTTGGKTMQFDDTYQTNVTGAFTVTGTDCSTLVNLDSETDNNQWDIYVSGTYNIDYADVEDSNAVTTPLTADSSKAVNDNNTNWTINEGSCGAVQPRIKGGTRINGGVRIK